MKGMSERAKRKMGKTKQKLLSAVFAAAAILSFSVGAYAAGPDITITASFDGLTDDDEWEFEGWDGSGEQPSEENEDDDNDPDDGEEPDENDSEDEEMPDEDDPDDGEETDEKIQADEKEKEDEEQEGKKSEDPSKSSSNKAEIKSYTATANSITLKWKKVKGADGYNVYEINGKNAKKRASSDGTSAKITDLEPAEQHIYVVRPYTVQSDGSKKNGKFSDEYTAITAPEKSGTKLTTFKYNHKKRKVTLNWKEAKCTGYLIYAYYGGQWVKVKTVNDPKQTSAVLELGSSYSDDDFWSFFFMPSDTKELALSSQGGLAGYRFAVKTFTRDSDKNGSFTSRLNSMKEVYYDINDIKDYAGESNYELLKKVLKKNYTGKSGRQYTIYTTSMDDDGKISSDKRTGYITDADIKAIEAFSKKHFGDDWDDAEKLMYTINWIHRNVDYDYEYTYPGGGFADNIFTYKTGQCDSYNGTLTEMLTYWGYKDVFLQCMTPSVRSSQHLRTAIYSSKKYYTFEAGNKKDGNWFWFIHKGLEVPLKSSSSKKSA